MSVELLGAGNDRVDFGDIAAIDGLTGITLAITIKLDAGGFADSDRLITKWGASNNAFIIQVIDTDELAFAVETDLAGFHPYGEKTTDSPLADDALLRMVFRWAAVGDLDIWVNGAVRTTTSWFSNTVNVIRSGTTHAIQCGHQSSSSVDGVDGDYSEFAMWDHKVPDRVARAYGVGYSPRFYRNGGIIYSSLKHTGNIVNEWDRTVTVTNTGAADASHPKMYYPAPAWSPMAASAAPPVASATPLLGLLGAGV